MASDVEDEAAEDSAEESEDDDDDDDATAPAAKRVKSTTSVGEGIKRVAKTQTGVIVSSWRSVHKKVSIHANLHARTHIYACTGTTQTC